MEKTPLELYETAYRLHYSENRITDAVAYYKKLIEVFPDSNECGYAVIQLQKIKAHTVAKDLQNISAPARPVSQPIAYIALFCALIAIVFNGIIYKQYKKNIADEQIRVTIALNALGNQLRGENEEALKLLSQLKEFQRDDIFPYEVSADIYRKQKKWEMGRNEYLQFFKRNPDRKPTESEKRWMSFEGKRLNKISPPVVQEQLKKNVPPPPYSRKKKIRNSKNKKTVTNPPAPSKKKRKGIYLVDPDSISYF